LGETLGKEVTTMIKLARIGEVRGQNVIDITVKNNRNHVLAPTWELVMSFKNKKISWEEYKKEYTALLNQRFKTRMKEFEVLIQMARSTETYWFVCFCKDENFCHRKLAKEFIEKLAFTET
jgi:uncharacterized protein YeaO (DUF488 family)